MQDLNMKNLQHEFIQKCNKLNTKFVILNLNTGIINLGT